MLRKLPQQLADGRQGQLGLFGQAAGGMRRLFRAARYVRHQHNAVIRQFVESEHRVLRVLHTSHTGQQANTIPIQYYFIVWMAAEYKTGMVLISLKYDTCASAKRLRQILIIPGTKMLPRNIRNHRENLGLLLLIACLVSLLRHAARLRGKRRLAGDEAEN